MTRWLRRLLAPRYTHRIGRLRVTAPSAGDALDVLRMCRDAGLWTSNGYRVPVIVVRDDDPRMSGTPRGLVACDGERLYVRASDWPLLETVLLRHGTSAEVAAEAIRKAMG